MGGGGGYYLAPIKARTGNKGHAKKMLDPSPTTARSLRSVGRLPQGGWML
jgi:hypothetical protein